jgi:sigma-B regulation protein RsbU (phosphoserine phosphatase)
VEALLEITQAINNNLPEDSLYKIYEFTLRANLNIKKLALYVLDALWICKVNYGTDHNFVDCHFDEVFLNYNDVVHIDKGMCRSEFLEFDLVIPIAHKEKKLAFVFVSQQKSGKHGSLNTDFVQALSNIIIVAIENKKLARKQLEQEKIRQELEFAGKVQQFLFPKKLPYNEHLKVAAFYQPHHSIGGDYYDFIKLKRKNQFLFCIADVSGKGIPAALLMSNFQASLRTLVEETTLLQDVICKLNYQIMNNAEGEHFITFFIGIYDAGRSRLKYVNSGHNPPVLKRGHKMMLLEKGSTVLGAFRELPFLEVGIIENINKFLFCSFTDGLSEINNDTGEEFGAERVWSIMEENQEMDPEILNKKIINSMNSFKGEQELLDDITLFTCFFDNTSGRLTPDR